MPERCCLGATDRAIGLVDRFAGCFSDGRTADRVVHDVATLVGQRVFGIALGYEDLIWIRTSCATTLFLARFWAGLRGASFGIVRRWRASRR